MNAEERDFLMMRKEISQTVFCEMCRSKYRLGNLSSFCYLCAVVTEV